IITEVHIYGITIFPSDSLERFFDRLVGRRANMEEIEDFLEDVVAYYKRAGYSLADFDTVNLKEDGVLEAKFNERAIEKITFIGNNRTRNWMVRSYLLFKEGDIFNEKNLEESVNRLYSTGLFRIVHYKIREFGSGVEIILIFEESEPGLLRVGVRYDLLSKNELSLSIVDKNIFGLATRFSAKCIYGERRNYFGVELVTDRLWKTHITTSFLASYRNKSLDIFDKSFKILELKEKRRGLTIRFGQHISRLGLFLVELSTEHITLKEFGNIRERYATHTLTFRSIVDSYDRAQFPTSGKYHTSYLKLSQNILGSQTSYWQTFLLFESYYSFFRQYLSFHPRLSFGLSGGFLPLSETFALGDYAPFWGFRGGEIRGYSTLLTGIDIILNLPYNLHLLSGIVVGNAWGKKERVKFDELTWGYGAGVGIRTPAGPIKLLWGKNKLKRERLEFKVGFEF
ncbi:MAG: BamA/TamA family outer membrane protein, partial [bacterium]